MPYYRPYPIIDPTIPYYRPYPIIDPTIPYYRPYPRMYVVVDTSYLIWHTHTRYTLTHTGPRAGYIVTFILSGVMPPPPPQKAPTSLTLSLIKCLTGLGRDLRRQPTRAVRNIEHWQSQGHAIGECSWGIKTDIMDILLRR